MYFSKLPNLELSKKPIRFPISDTEYVLAKNLFRKYQISSKNFTSSIYFNKYTISDDDRLDLISNKFYGSPEYDWVIMLTNSIINPYYDFPLKDSQLYDFVVNNYDDPNEIHHYETLQLKNSKGQVILKEGLIVDNVFYNSPYKYYDNGVVQTIPGNTISQPITNYEYERSLNNKKREIYILRPELLERFVSEFENIAEYSRSGDFIDRNTKKTGI